MFFIVVIGWFVMDVRILWLMRLVLWKYILVSSGKILKWWVYFVLYGFRLFIFILLFWGLIGWMILIVFCLCGSGLCVWMNCGVLRFFCVGFVCFWYLDFLEILDWRVFCFCLWRFFGFLMGFLLSVFILLDIFNIFIVDWVVGGFWKSLFKVCFLV